MKKYALLSFVALAGVSNASHAAIDWWQQPTICKLNPATCYANMGAGYAADEWDDVSKCRGKKLICADALRTTSSEDMVAMGRDEIARGNVIRPDFDASILNPEYGDCFGARRTASDGSMAARPDGTYTMVWCPNVLSKTPDAIVENGEVVFGATPTCAELARDGYVATKNNSKNCFGVYYDPAKYSIDCGGMGQMPRRIIVLNGANVDAVIPDGANFEDLEQSETQKLFDKMHAAAIQQHNKYFGTK